MKNKNLIKQMILFLVTMFMIFIIYHNIFFKNTEKFSMNDIDDMFDDVTKMTTIVNDIPKELTNVTKKINDNIRKIEENVDQKINNNISKIEQNVGQKITDNISKIEQNVGQKITDNITKIEQNVGQKITDNISKIEQNVGQKITDNITKIEQNVGQKITDNISKIEQNVGQKINDNITKIKEDIEEGTNQIRNEIKQELTTFFTTKIKNIFIQISKIIKKGIVDPILDVFIGIGSIFGQIFNILKEIANKIVSLPNCMFTYAIKSTIDTLYFFYDKITPTFLQKIFAPIYHYTFRYIFDFVGYITGYNDSVKKCYGFDVASEVNNMKTEINNIQSSFQKDFGRLNFSEIQF